MNFHDYCEMLYGDRAKVNREEDKAFLLWLRDRLVNIYHESPNVDFVQRLEELAERR